MQKSEIRIREFRKARGLTQKELAANLGLKNSRLSRYEAGDREPSISTLINLANFFDTSIDVLVGRTK